MKEYKDNPFTFKVKHGEKLTNVGAVPEEEDLVFANKRVLDKTQYTKVYEHNFDFLLELTKNGLRVFCYIAKYLVKFNSDEIYVYEPDFQEKEEYTCTTRNFNKGIKDLVDNKILAKSTRPYIYYINPSIFFQGERRYLLIK